MAFTQSWQFVQRPTLVRASAELFLSKSYHLGEARGRRQRKPEWAGNVCVVGEGAPAWREVFTCKGEPQWRHIAWKAGGYGGGGRLWRWGLPDGEGVRLPTVCFD